MPKQNEIGNEETFVPQEEAFTEQQLVSNMIGAPTM